MVSVIWTENNYFDTVSAAYASVTIRCFSKKAKLGITHTTPYNLKCHHSPEIGGEQDGEICGNVDVNELGNGNTVIK